MSCCADVADLLGQLSRLGVVAYHRAHRCGQSAARAAAKEKRGR
jgi:hypothetical protein